MYINNDDLEFLIRLENDLWIVHGWSDDVRTLCKLKEKLIQQKERWRKKKNVGGQDDKVK